MTECYKIEEINGRTVISGGQKMEYSPFKYCQQCGEMMVQGKDKKFKCCIKQTDWIANLERDAQNLKRSASRAYKQATKIGKCINVDRMLTLTFKDNVIDDSIALAVWQDFRRRMYDDNLRFTYICVPERQQRGAIHFHVGIGKFILWSDLWRHWRAACEQITGHTGGVYINRKAQKHKGGVAKYILKYIYKGIHNGGALFGKGRKRYYHNANIEKVEEGKLSWHDWRALRSGWGNVVERDYYYKESFQKRDIDYWIERIFGLKATKNKNYEFKEFFLCGKKIETFQIII